MSRSTLRQLRGYAHPQRGKPLVMRVRAVHGRRADAVNEGRELAVPCFALKVEINKRNQASPIVLSLPDTYIML